jgi:hypothetical protein
MTTSILVTGAATAGGDSYQPIAKGAAVTAGRRYCLPEFTIRASCLS